MFSKGTKFFCNKCGDHIATLVIDVEFGMFLSETLLDRNDGQAPWNAYERMVCRKCGEAWTIGFNQKHMIPGSSLIFRAQKG